MTARPATRGVGSNQYRSRPPTAKVSRQELDDIAWAFHPERPRWLEAGVPDEDARAWTRMGVSYTASGKWRQAAFTPSMAHPWLERGCTRPSEVVGHYRTVVYRAAREPGGPAIPEFHNNAAPRVNEYSEVQLVTRNGGIADQYQVGAEDGVAGFVYVDPFVTHVPVPPLTEGEVALYTAVMDAYPQRRGGWSDLRAALADESQLVAVRTLLDLENGWDRYWGHRAAAPDDSDLFVTAHRKLLGFKPRNPSLDLPGSDPST